MRRLHAFICYRRSDAFMLQDQLDKPDFNFLNKLKEALLQAGFEDVFFDTDAQFGIQPSENYEGRLHRAISNSDLFIVLIGNNWLNILRENRQQDILVRELRAAINQEKQILPILIDGATMPNPKDLPRPIRTFHYKSAISIASSDHLQNILKALNNVPRVTYIRKLGRGWLVTYAFISLLMYYLCAIHIHDVGIMEYGKPAWLGMTEMWSAFYIWPVFFLPFVLAALFGPLTTLIEFAISGSRFRDAIIYLSPLVFGSVLAAFGVSIELVNSDQVPWTIQLMLPQPGCENGPVSAPSPLVDLSSYDRADHLKGEYTTQPFWLKSKCWPNVLFYVTIPRHQGLADKEYERERVSVQRSFMIVLGNDFEASYSGVFSAYLASVAIFVWLCGVISTMSVFYITVEIRHPNDDAILKVPSENALLGLTYAFVALILWFPFRMNTLVFKSIYSCGDPSQCVFGPDHYVQDIILLTMLLICYMSLAFGLIYKHRRLKSGLIGCVAVMLIVLCGIGLILFNKVVAPLTERWEFYVGVSIPVSMILLALWYQFDPVNIRFNDFRREIDFDPS